MQSIMFTGVKGVGKSTLVSRLGAELAMPHVDYADFMLAVMATYDKDRIELLSAAERREVISRVEEYLVANSVFAHDGSHVLFENHLSVIKGGQFETREPETYRQFSPVGLCVVHAEPEEILARRRSDRRRNRPQEDSQLVAAQQEENRRQARIISEYFSIPELFLYNGPGDLPLSEAANWVRSVLHRHQDLDWNQ